MSNKSITEYKLATSSWDKKELDAIQKVINSGIFTMSDNVKKFEENIQNLLGKILCNGQFWIFSKFRNWKLILY